MSDQEPTDAPNGMSLATVWETVADTVPSAAALVHGDLVRTWAELDDRAARLGADSGDVVDRQAGFQRSLLPGRIDLQVAVVGVREINRVVVEARADADLCRRGGGRRHTGSR